MLTDEELRARADAHFKHIGEYGEDPKKRSQSLRDQAKKSFENHQISKVLGSGHWLLQQPYTKSPAGWDWTMAAEIAVFQGGKIIVWGDIGPVMFAYYGAYKDPVQVIRWMGANKDIEYYVHQKAAIGSGGGSQAIEEWDSDVARFQILRAIDDHIKEAEDPDDEIINVLQEAIDTHDVVISSGEDEPSTMEFVADEFHVISSGIKWTNGEPSRVKEIINIVRTLREVPEEQLVEKMKGIVSERRRELLGDDKFVTALQEALKHHRSDERFGFYQFLYDALGYDEMEGLGSVGMVMSANVYFAHAALARLIHLLDLEKEKESGGAERQDTESSGAARLQG